MNGAVTKFNGDSETNNLNAKEEIVDFSGKGLKLDTEADGLFWFYVCFINGIKVIFIGIFQQPNLLLMQFRLQKVWRVSSLKETLLVLKPPRLLPKH